MAYAEKRIAELRLGAGGDLGTEFVCVYDDAGPGAVRLSDGQGLNSRCLSTDDIDAELEAIREWCDEE